jgi:hypothetical protein
VPHDADPSRIKSRQAQWGVSKQIINQKTYVRHSTADDPFDTRGAFCGGLADFTLQLGNEGLRVVESGNDVAVGSEVGGEKGCGASVTPTVMRKDNKWRSAGVSSWIPGFALEDPIAPRVAGFESLRFDKKRTGREWIVSRLNHRDPFSLRRWSEVTAPVV